MAFFLRILAITFMLSMLLSCRQANLPVHQVNNDFSFNQEIESVNAIFSESTDLQDEDKRGSY